MTRLGTLNLSARFDECAARASRKVKVCIDCGADIVHGQGRRCPSCSSERMRLQKLEHDRKWRLGRKVRG